MSRRLIGFVVASVALLAAAGCGSGGGDASVRSGHGAVAAAAGEVDAAGMRTVAYHGLEFDVPGSWPVYDLDAAPSTCVRFDVNAVYLGHPGADMQCPAGIVGRADAVLVEPGVESPDAAVSVESVNGLEAAGRRSRRRHPARSRRCSRPRARARRSTYRESDATVRHRSSPRSGAWAS